jgi:hypothetical protein
MKLTTRQVEVRMASRAAIGEALEDFENPSRKESYRKLYDRTTHILATLAAYGLVIHEQRTKEEYPCE